MWILNLLGGFWLGFSIARFTDLGITTWKFWAIVLPTIILLTTGGI